MRRRMMKSKIHRATVTDANLHYVGSVTVDRDLMDAADLLEYEQVAVVDIDNGARLETYVIEGPRGSGEICLNGAAARLVQPGDRVIIISYADYDDVELHDGHEPTIVHVDTANRPVADVQRASDRWYHEIDAGELTESLDLLVLGSGVAGLSAAVRAADLHGMRVGVLTKGELHQATTRWAQGGVAAVLGGADPDSTDLHLADTLAAGAGLCDADAVRVLVDEGPRRVNELIALGARFDQDESGGYQLAREGGHSHARVLHAGGAATGVEVERALVDAVNATAAVVLEHHFAVDLVVEHGRSAGVTAIDAGGAAVQVRAANVLLATGGAGQLFAVTTNPAEATGDGVAMALRAGVAVADVEFVQFHPTALHHPAMPRPLLSEALRGHGAVVRDARGERFVDELLPRDQVSRAMTARMLEQDVEHLWLDATGLDHFAERFPTIAAALANVGLDPAKDWLPIAPAADYSCGGVVTDLDGAASLPGLWAAGEVACNGVHGANRLASNSLLDGMVFGPRVVEAIDRGKHGPEPTGAMRAVLGGDDDAIGGRPVVVAHRAPPTDRRSRRATPVDDARDTLQRALTAHAGVLRSANSLTASGDAIDTAEAAVDASSGPATASAELENLCTVARALVAAATARTESRGAHDRTDHPGTRDEFRLRLVLTRPPARR